MVEALSTSLVFPITFLGQMQHCPRILQLGSCCFHFGSDINTNSWRAETCGRFYLVPRCKSSMLLSRCPSRVSAVKFRSVLEEENACIGEEDKEVSDEGDFNDLKPPPPWGNLAAEDKLDVHSTIGDDSSIGSKWKPNVNTKRLQFLEERDEEILSQRVLKLSRRNKVRSVMELFDSMEVSGLKPNSYACNSLLSCLLRNARIDDALRVFEFMKASDLTTEHTFSIILKGIAEAKDSNAAVEMFEELAANSDVKRGFDEAVYNTMITICGKERDWLRIEKIWREMKNDGHVANKITYSLLVCIFVRCYQYELAIDAYHEMVQNGFQPPEDVMQAAIGAYVKEGKWCSALCVFQDMLNRGLKPSIVTCNTLINSLGKGGKVDLAFRVFGHMKSLDLSPDAYTWKALIGGLCRANRYSDALRLFEIIQQEDTTALNLHVYNAALLACQRLRLWQRALQILWQMEQESGLSLSTASYNHVIGACEAARKPRVALQVYQHMIHKSHTPDTFTLLSLLRCCIWGSLWDEMEEILNVLPNASLYNAAIQGLCLTGNYDSGKKLYIEMREKGLEPDGKTRALMLQNLPRS